MAPIPEEVLAHVTAFLTLSPGVPASEQNLDVLLAYLLSRWRTCLTRATATNARPMIRFEVEGSKKKKVLVMNVYESFLNTKEWSTTCSDRISFFESIHPTTTAGLLAALTDAKGALKDLNRGLCPDCSSSEPPRKRLKGRGLPTCPSCTMLNACGL